MAARLLKHFLFSSFLALQVTTANAQSSEYLIPADHSTITEAIRSSQSDLVLVNMWATWCSPCLEEFPELVEIYSIWSEAGTELLFVSVDFEEQYSDAVQFLRTQGWERPSFFKQEADHPFVDGISTDWSGAIPATFLFGNTGQLYWMTESQTTFAELDSVLTHYSTIVRSE